MFTFVIAQRLGFESDLTLGLSLLEGVCLTIVVMLMVERTLFSTTSPVSRTPIVRQAGADGVEAASTDAGSGGATGTQS